LFQRIWLLILKVVRTLFALLQSAFGSSTQITLDTGLQVRVGKQIAEGGFSFVFEAHGIDHDSGTTYALKRANCMDDETLQLCRRESGVHRSVRHPNLMPLLGMSVLKDGPSSRVCYMLFPYVPLSLRAEVNRRVLNESSPPRPFTELKALQLFSGILYGVQAMHSANYSHRDIKPENVLLQENHSSSFKPILMDFGSVGSLTQPIQTRRQVLEVMEHAAQHTTFPYRPPELLEGGVRAGDNDIDFAKVDVWSLGCLLFAMFFGSSPFEMEFRRPSGQIRIVECGHLRILGDLPVPPMQADAADWVSPPTFQVIQWMLNKNRNKRPGLEDVIQKVESRIKELGGRIVRPEDDEAPDQDSDLEDLLGNHRDFGV